jgi:hypothetical protein
MVTYLNSIGVGSNGVVTTNEAAVAQSSHAPVGLIEAWI